MASASAGDIGRQLGRLFGAGSAVGLTDGELLERFADRRDESAEAAFETILARHGGLVLTVCRQVLGDAHAAEDAFQATFLVLVRRAASLRVREQGSLGPWLHGVAYRIALKARQGAARRRTRERRAAMAAVETASDAIEHDELQALLHEEVNRLPAKYRAPVVLCYFEGRTHDEAAAALQWPVGTVRSRLSRPATCSESGSPAAAWRRADGSEPSAGADRPARAPRTAAGGDRRRRDQGDAGRGRRRDGEPDAQEPAPGEARDDRGRARDRLDDGRLRPRPPARAGIAGPAAVRDHPGADTTARIVSTPIDRRADPLPEHARLRIGGTRFNHGDSIRQVLYTPDGKSLVAIDGTDVVRVWDAATGTDGPRHRRSPDRVSGRSRSRPTARRWRRSKTQASSGSGTWPPGARSGWHEAGEDSRYMDSRHLAFSPDGRTLAAGLSSIDQATKTTRSPSPLGYAVPRSIGAGSRPTGAAEGPRVHSRWQGPGHGQQRHRVDASSARSGPEKGSMRLWDVATGRERRRFPVEGFHVQSVAVSPDGKLLAAGVSDQTIRIYDLATGQERDPRLGGAGGRSGGRRSRPTRRGNRHVR